MYYSEVFGLSIGSSIELPHSLELVGDLDVSIQEVEDLQFVDTTNELFFFDYKDILKLMVSNGHTVQFSRYSNVEDRSIQEYLLGHALGILLLQRKVLVFHANAIELKGQGVVLAGDSSSGKSTLSANLIANGAKFISDEHAVIESGRLLTGFQELRLVEESKKYLPIEKVRSFEVDPITRRHIVQLHDGFSNKSVKLDKLILLAVGNEVTCKKVLGVEKIKIFLKGLYKPSVYQSRKLSKGEWLKAQELISTLDVYLITRPVNEDTVQEISAIILNLD